VWSDFDTIAGVDLALAVIRQVIAKLGYQHMGQQPRTRIAALNGPRRCGGLHDLLAGTAGILRSDVLDDLPVLRYILEHLGRILPQRA
jgi:hypothetical protein